MKTKMRLILFCFFAALVPGLSHGGAILIDFEDLSSGSAIGPAYQGLTWSSDWYTYDDASYASIYGNTYGSNDGNIFAYNGGGVSTVSFAGGPIDLLSLDASTWASNNSFVGFSSTTLTVEGYLNSVLVGSVVVNLSSTAFVNTAIGLNNIDEVKFLNDNGNSGRWFLVDNLSINNPADVPEPSTLTLLGLGLLGLSRRRRFLKKAA